MPAPFGSALAGEFTAQKCWYLPPLAPATPVEQSVADSTHGASAPHAFGAMLHMRDVLKQSCAAAAAAAEAR